MAPKSRFEIPNHLQIGTNNSDTKNVETVVLKNTDNQWNVSDLLQGYGPYFAPDGNTMHFGKGYKEHTDTGWSEMKSLGSPFAEIRIMKPQISLDGGAMHKSKLAGFIIDCNTSDLNSASVFWGEALGMQIKTLPQSEGEKYVKLLDPNSDLHIEVQKVKHESRVHLDIETDNIEAEVKRLEGLGAKKVAYVESWCVMEAPTGQKFCVVRNASPNFDQEATEWV